jgi:hypothetical protein
MDWQLAWDVPFIRLTPFLSPKKLNANRDKSETPPNEKTEE